MAVVNPSFAPSMKASYTFMCFNKPDRIKTMMMTNKVMLAN